MWVTKLLISQVKKKDFLPQNDKIWPKIGIFGQFGPGHCSPVGGSVGGCGARAVSRKTPIYFINMYRGTQVLHTFRQICSCTSSMITCAVYMRSYASSLAWLESSLELQEHNVFVLHLPFLLLNQFPCNYDVNKCLIDVSVCFILKRKLLGTL